MARRLRALVLPPHGFGSVREARIASGLSRPVFSRYLCAGSTRRRIASSVPQDGAAISLVPRREVETVVFTVPRASQGRPCPGCANGSQVEQAEKRSRVTTPSGPP